MTKLGVLKRQYGSGRGRHLRFDPDAAEELGKDLIEMAKAAREDEVHF